MTSGGTRHDEAGELFVKAGNIFKKDKQFEDAVNAFVKAANAFAQANSAHDAATSYVQAAHCAKNANNVSGVVDFLQRAVDIYTDEGKFSMAGKHQKEIAELFEAEKDNENAMKAYKLAADTFGSENNEKANARACLLKVAMYASELEDYTTAIDIFEQVAHDNLEGLGRFSVKEYLLKAGLCKLASGDMVSMHQALDRYKDMLYTFARDRECKFLEDVLAACEAFDLDAFTRAVVDFDSITPLDPWKTTILTRIRKGLQTGGDLGGEGEDGTLDLK